MSNRALGLAIVATLLTPFTAWAQTPPPASSASAITTGSPRSYVLGPDDLLEVGLIGRTDFGGRARVQGDGTVQLPLVGKIRAADRTTNELADEIRKALRAGGYYADPVVTVEIISYSSRYLIVLGSVANPGLIPMDRPYRVSEILARVGGVRETAADYALVVSQDGMEQRLNITEMATSGGTKDPYLKAGDKIFVPTAPTFFIYGKVNAPGEFVLRNDTTLRMAIAKGGGLAEAGSDKKVTVTRNGKKAKLSLDDKVASGDVIVVGERLF